MEKSENGQFKNNFSNFYNSKFPNNSKAGSNQFEEGTSSGSSFLEVDDRNRISKKSNVASSNISTMTSLTSALGVGKQTPMFNAIDMNEYSSDDPATHAPLCMMCLIENARKPATHFCELCEPRGKYICHACLQQHNKWCPNHSPDSLSVKRQIGQSNKKEDIPNDGYIRPDEWKHREERIPVTRGIEEYGYVESWLERENADGNPDVSGARDVTETRYDRETLTSLDYPSTLNNFTDKRPIEPPPLPPFRYRLPILPPTPEVDIESTTDGSHTTEFVDYDSIGTHLRPYSGVSNNWRRRQRQIAESRMDPEYAIEAFNIEGHDIVSQSGARILRGHDYSTLDRLDDIYNSHYYDSYETRANPDNPRFPNKTQKKRCSIM